MPTRKVTLAEIAPYFDKAIADVAGAKRREALHSLALIVGPVPECARRVRARLALQGSSACALPSSRRSAASTAYDDGHSASYRASTK